MDRVYVDEHRDPVLSSIVVWHSFPSEVILLASIVSHNILHKSTAAVLDVVLPAEQQLWSIVLLCTASLKDLSAVGMAAASDVDWAGRVRVFHCPGGVQEILRSKASFSEDRHQLTWCMVTSCISFCISQKQYLVRYQYSYIGAKGACLTDLVNCTL